MVAFSLAEIILNASFVLSRGLHTVSLSGNWMWPTKKPHQKATLYKAVEALSHYAQQLTINIPVGKDSMSMSVEHIDAPGTLLLSLFAFVHDTSKRVTPELKNRE
jgi:phosphoribosylformylglycinamidine synthase